MRARLLAAAPLVVAAILYAGVAVPLRAQARAAAEEFGRARRERHAVQARLAPLERQERARSQAARVFAVAASEEGGAAPAVRRAVLGTLESAPVSGVRLAVRPGRGAVGVTVKVSATGSFPDAVRLSGDLVAPGNGLVLERVRLERRPGRRQIGLELDAFSLGARP